MPPWDNGNGQAKSGEAKQTHSHKEVAVTPQSIVSPRLRFLFMPMSIYPKDN